MGFCESQYPSCIVVHTATSIKIKPCPLFLSNPNGQLFEKYYANIKQKFNPIENIQIIRRYELEIGYRILQEYALLPQAP